MPRDYRYHFLVVFFIGSAGLLLFLCLMPTGSHPNLLGRVGSDLSFWIYSAFGLWALVFPFLLILSVISQFRDKPFSKAEFKIPGILLGLTALCVATHVLAPSPMFSPPQMREGVEWGGKFGILVGERMESIFTRFGTIVLCLLGLVLSLLLLEKEALLLAALRLSLEGTGKGFQWLINNGFGIGAAFVKGSQKTLSEWKARQQEKKIAQGAREKLKAESKAFTPPQVVFPTRKESFARKSNFGGEEPLLPAIRFKNNSGEHNPVPRQINAQGSEDYGG